MLCLAFCLSLVTLKTIWRALSQAVKLCPNLALPHVIAPRWHQTVTLQCSHILFSTFIFQGWHLYFAASSKKPEKQPLCRRLSICLSMKSYLAVHGLYDLHKDCDHMVSMMEIAGSQYLFSAWTNLLYLLGSEWLTITNYTLVGCSHNCWVLERPIFDPYNYSFIGFTDIA